MYFSKSPQAKYYVEAVTLVHFAKSARSTEELRQMQCVRSEPPISV